jgi:hypothetical protein
VTKREQQTVLFPDLFDRLIVATFDRAHASSDGGAVLLKAADARLSVTAAPADYLTDARPSSRIAPHNAGRNGCSALRAGIQTPTTPIVWRTIRCRSCCSTAIRSTALPDVMIPTEWLDC